VSTRDELAKQSDKGQPAPYTMAGPVRITRSDGFVETRPALTEGEFEAVIEDGLRRARRERRAGE